MKRKSTLRDWLGHHCGARLSGGRGLCRAWAVKGKQRCKWHGGRSTGPRTTEGLTRTLAAMKSGRVRKIEMRQALGLQMRGGRPPRIPDWLRRAIVDGAEKELAGIDLETVLTAEMPPLDEMSDNEKLAWLERLDTAMLLDLLRPTVADKNRNRSAVSLAWRASQVRKFRVERGDKQRSQLDELIEDVASS